MKKKLLALAVAGALTAPLAAQAQNVQIYGVLQMSVDRVDNGDDTGTSMKDNSSRIGFRGSEDLGGGLKAIFQLESAVQPDERGADGGWTKRDSWVGLASSTWGEIRVGS
ncbi:MAG: porin, partial [Pseudomonadota bacterium]